MVHHRAQAWAAKLARDERHWFFAVLVAQGFLWFGVGYWFALLVVVRNGNGVGDIIAWALGLALLAFASSYVLYVLAKVDPRRKTA